jgi:hypothetical protein
MQAEQERVIKLADGAIRQEMDAVLSDLRYLSQHNAIRNHLARDSRSSRLDLAMEYVGLARGRSASTIRFASSVWTAGRWCASTSTMGTPKSSRTGSRGQARPRLISRKPCGCRRARSTSRRFDLNPGPGAAQPHKPVIRFATPVADEQGLIRGMVVLDYLGQRLRDKLVALQGQAGKIHGCSTHRGIGSWAPARTTESGLTDRGRSQRRLADVVRAVWRQMESEQSGVHQTDASLIRFERVYPLLGENLTPAQETGYAVPGRRGPLFLDGCRRVLAVGHAGGQSGLAEKAVDDLRRWCCSLSWSPARLP